MTESSAEKQQKPIPLWATPLLWVNDNLIFNAPGKPVVQMNWAINCHKIFTLFIVLVMMFATNNFSVGAWVYLALHGVYGYCWLIKDFAFRDPGFEQKTSVFGVFNLYTILIAWYWLLPWLFLSRHIEPTGADLFFVIAIHTLGVVLMLAADGQRHWVTKYRKGLINFGVYRYTRNPNYLGELMLYFAYAYLANHWITWLIYVYMAIFFLARMTRKDHSISRHDGWEKYERESGLLIPWALFNGRAFKNLFTDTKLDNT